MNPPHVKAVMFDVSADRPVYPAVLIGITPGRLPSRLHAVAPDGRCCAPKPVHRNRRLRKGTWLADQLPECVHVRTTPPLSRGADPDLSPQNVPWFGRRLAEI